MKLTIMYDTKSRALHFVQGDSVGHGPFLPRTQVLASHETGAPQSRKQSKSWRFEVGDKTVKVQIQEVSK